MPSHFERYAQVKERFPKFSVQQIHNICFIFLVFFNIHHLEMNPPGKKNNTNSTTPPVVSSSASARYFVPLPPQQPLELQLAVPPVRCQVGQKNVERFQLVFSRFVILGCFFFEIFELGMQKSKEIKMLVTGPLWY